MRRYSLGKKILTAFVLCAIQSGVQAGPGMVAAKDLFNRYTALCSTAKAYQYGTVGADFFCSFRTGQICLDLAKLIYKNGEEKSVGTDFWGNNIPLIWSGGIDEENSPVVKTIKMAEDLINDININKPVVTDNILDIVDGLLDISKTIEKMAEIPAIQHVEYHGFDANIAFVESGDVIKIGNVCTSLRCRDNVAKLLRDMKNKHAYILELCKKLLRLAISKSDDNKKLKEKLNEIEKKDQEVNLEKAKALVDAEKDKVAAAGKLDDLQKKGASLEDITKAKAELLVKTNLEKQFNGLDENAKKLLQKSLKPEEQSKIDKLLEKIKWDVANNQKKQLGEDILSESLKLEAKDEETFPGLSKSLNEHLSDASVSIFIQIFQEIKSYLEKEKNSVSRRTIFNAFKQLPNVPSFLNLVYYSGIMGSVKKVKGKIQNYKGGAVNPENLIKLINAYKEMCGQFGKSIAFGEFLAEKKKTLDGAIEELKAVQAFLVEEAQKKVADLEKKGGVAPEPEPVPEPKGVPSGEQELKLSLGKLKKALHELKMKFENLQNKLENLQLKLTS